MYIEDIVIEGFKSYASKVEEKIHKENFRVQSEMRDEILS